MCAMVKNYFAHLFTRENGEIDSSVLESIPRKVTDDMNEVLLLPYTEQEVKEALFNIGDLKAPGPDGLHAIFYKRFWSMLGDDLVTEVLQAVNSCMIPNGWNNTTVVLIPKVARAHTAPRGPFNVHAVPLRLSFRHSHGFCGFDDAHSPFRPVCACFSHC